MLLLYFPGGIVKDSQTGRKSIYKLYNENGTFAEFSKPQEPLATLPNPLIPKIEPINTRQEVAKIAKVSKAQSITVDRCAPLYVEFKIRMWARVIMNSV